MALPSKATVLTTITKTPYFTVRYAAPDKALAESAADAAQKEFVRVSNDLGYTIQPGRPIPLNIYSSHYYFIKEGAVKDRFTVGTTRTGDETIAIDASGTFASTRQIIAHEITHAVIFRILGVNAWALPLWANEGLAKYESETYAVDDDAIIAEAASHSELIPLANLTSSFPSDRSSLAYAESWSAIRYLVKLHGRYAPREMLAELAGSGSFDKAIAKATGENGSRFVSGWTGSLSHKFNYARAWQIAAAFLGPIMAVLAIFAFIARRKKMREAARQWEWEEFEESMERQLREWPHR